MNKTSDADKYAEYRDLILETHDVDIDNFKQVEEGRAFGKPITNYNIEQLLIGMEVEMEHTKNPLFALTISMDHLEEFSDYYDRLLKMEDEAKAELNIKESSILNSELTEGDLKKQTKAVIDAIIPLRDNLYQHYAGQGFSDQQIKRKVPYAFLRGAIYTLTGWNKNILGYWEA